MWTPTMISRQSETRIVCAAIVMLVSLDPLLTTVLAETNKHYVRTKQRETPKPSIAMDNVCAWPNLTVMYDGEIIATIFNKPSHGKI